MIISLIRSGADFKEILITLLVSLPAVLIAITFHEFAHGFAAYKLGDPTARNMGRLSLNPAAHFDLIGTLALLFAGFGWAKPVPFNTRYFKHYKRDTALVALAGPIANFIVAFVAFFLMAIMEQFDLASVGDLSYKLLSIIYTMLNLIVSLNVGLMIFNLIPIPPLDGSKVLITVLPARAHNFMLNYERYGMMIMIFVLFSGVLDYPLIWARGLVLGLFQAVTNLFF